LQFFDCDYFRVPFFIFIFSTSKTWRQKTVAKKISDCEIGNCGHQFFIFVQDESEKAIADNATAVDEDSQLAKI